jgi:glyoxylase-like metal-dependent hydrolase (beta-lactamase superfamily II)
MRRPMVISLAAASIVLTSVLFSSIPIERAASPVKMTVLFDNTVAGNEGTAGWGFACLIEGPEKTILFDTGADKDIFLKNAALLKQDLTKVEIAVISHNHGDHTAGLFGVLQQTRDLPVFFPEQTPNAILDPVRTAGGRPEATTKIREICRDVFLDGKRRLRSRLGPPDAKRPGPSDRLCPSRDRGVPGPDE